MEPEAAKARSDLLRQAEQRLRAEGLWRARAYRVERRDPDRWWAAYERGGNAWTAIFAGELPQEWRLLRTLAGWPVAR
ncbi:MAG TPA: hypothetical protein VGE91_07275 [Solirubrobacterales bacterium]|jgi:hypothetical protein